jgi:hypothetical protein
MDVVDAMQRWLPYPKFRFVGGAYDGQSLVVEMIRTERGMIAPEVWNIMEPLPPPDYSTRGLVADTVVKALQYRFIRTPGTFNGGYYELAAPAAQPSTAGTPDKPGAPSEPRRPTT